VTNLRVEVITSEGDLVAYGDAWQELAALDDHASLFNDWHWNYLWWQHYKQLGNLHVIMVFDNDKLVGVGPFYRNNSKAMGLGKIDTLRFIGTGGNTSPDNLNIITHPDHRQSVADVICDSIRSEQFQRVLFMDVRSNSAFYKAFRSHVNSVPGYAVKPITHTRRVADLPNDWSSFRKQISRNTHKRMKARQNRLSALENVRFHKCETQEEVDVAYEALVRLHKARWKLKGHSTSFGSESYCAFHKALMRQLLLNNQLWLITLKVDDTIIAVEYAFLYKETLMFGFDPCFEHLSPGHVLMTYTIKTGIENGVRHIDLLKGNYKYKASYANQEMHSIDFGFYAKSVYSFVAKIKDHGLSLTRA